MQRSSKVVRRLLVNPCGIILDFAMGLLLTRIAIGFWRPHYYVYDEADEIVKFSLQESFRFSPISVAFGIFALIFFGCGIIGLLLRYLATNTNKNCRAEVT